MVIVLVASLGIGTRPAIASEAVAQILAQAEGAEVEPEAPPGLAHRILFYLPNRVFDVMDVVRARARIGSGIGVSARATSPASVFLGTYQSVFVGLPGPRSRPEVPLPFGVDNYQGIKLSVADRSTADDPYSPRYSPTEIGAGVHLFLPGVDVGIDPFEVLDLVTGFLFIDLRKDDY
jgi:hypothetical protein